MWFAPLAALCSKPRLGDPRLPSCFLVFAMAWVPPALGKSSSAAAGGAGPGRKGSGKGQVPGATPKRKAQPAKEQSKPAAQPASQPARRQRQQEGAGILATLGVVAKFLPRLESLGFGGSGGPRGRQPRHSEQRSGRRPAAAIKEDAGWTRSGGRVPKFPPKEITDHLGRPAMVVNMAGESVPMVAICATCHWGYWSLHWTTCVCCKVKRDPVAKPEPNVFKH